MVSARKKRSKKVPRTNKPIDEVPVATVGIVETESGELTSASEITGIESPTPEEIEQLEAVLKERPPQSTIIEPPTISEPQVRFVDETPLLHELLDSAPEVPFIQSLEEATAFVDRYRVWKRNVKAATG